MQGVLPLFDGDTGAVVARKLGLVAGGENEFPPRGAVPAHVLVSITFIIILTKVIIVTIVIIVIVTIITSVIIVTIVIIIRPCRCPWEQSTLLGRLEVGPRRQVPESLCHCQER